MSADRKYGRARKPMASAVSTTAATAVPTNAVRRAGALEVPAELEVVLQRLEVLEQCGDGRVAVGRDPLPAPDRRCAAVRPAGLHVADSGAGSRSRIRASTSAVLPLPNGSSPLIISYSSTPQLHTSVRASTSWPRACSGDMYSGGADDESRDRRQVRRGAAAGAAKLLGQLGDAEVEHLDVAVAAQHHVLGLDVAMDDALFMRGGERGTGLDGDVQATARLEAAARHRRAQRFAFDQLAGDVVDAVRSRRCRRR